TGNKWKNYEESMSWCDRVHNCLKRLSKSITVRLACRVGIFTAHAEPQLSGACMGSLLRPCGLAGRYANKSAGCGRTCSLRRLVLRVAWEWRRSSAREEIYFSVGPMSICLAGAGPGS